MSEKEILTLTDIIWQGFVALLSLLSAGVIILFTRLSNKVEKMTPLETFKEGQEAIMTEVRLIRQENKEDNKGVHERMDDLIIARRRGTSVINKEHRREGDL
jgi:hypothetical protein